MQQNNKFRLCGDRDEVINHIISKCSYLEQKENKTKYDWVGKVIHWDLYNKLTFDQTTNWYMHKPESVLENETLIFLLDFHIQKDHLILAKILDQVIIIKKENPPNIELCRTNGQ